MPNVIVPLDGSELAERAIPLAVTLAKLTGSDLKLVEAALSPPSLEAGIPIDIIVDGAQTYLEAQAAALQQQHHITVLAHTAIAPAVALILGEASQPDVTAVVMSSHGRTGILRLLMGSVAEGVLREAPSPVYLIPAADSTAAEARIRHILVPLDGSALSHSVLAPVTQLAKQVHARVTLVRVFRDQEELARAPEQPPLQAVEQQLDRLEDKAHTYFSPIKAQLHAAGLKVDTEWTTGVPAQEILATAELMQPDVIALATHGRSGIERMRYGSVAESLLRHARVPVMTFGPAALKRLANDAGSLAATNLAGAVNAP